MEWWGHSGMFGAAYDTDAQACITAVETADGQSLETGVRDAINTLVLALKAASIWTAAGQLLLPCGPRTLAGALVPLKGTAPTNNGFVSGDYNRKTGLGDASNTSKWLNSNVLQNSLGAASHALAWYGSITEASGDRTLIGSYNDISNQETSLLALDSYAAYVNGRAFRSGTYTVGRFPVASAASISCQIGSRTASNYAALYLDGTLTANAFSIAPLFEARSIGWFVLRTATGAIGICSNSILQIGGIFTSGLDATQAAAFRSASSAYVSSIAAAIP